MREQILTALGPTLLILLGVLGREVKRYIARRSYREDVEIIARRAAAVAADLQRDVDEAKSPESPGTWDSSVAARIRQQAIRKVRALEPLACESVLAALRGDSASLDELIATHVEEAVRSMRRAGK